MTDDWTQLTIVLALVGAAMLFLVDLALSVALVAVAALSPVALRRLSAESAERLGFLERMAHPPSAHRSAAVVLRQLSLLGATLLLVLGAQAAGWKFPVLGGIVLGAILGALLVEAIVARTVALWNPRLALRWTAAAVRGAYILLYPFVAPLHMGLRRLDGEQRSVEERDEVQEEEVEALIEVGERSGLLEAAEGEMMRGIVDLDETRVREIMTPRTDIVTLDAETTVAAARRTIIEAGHSRIPIYSGSIDNIVGVLHSRDLFQAWEANADQRPVARYLRPAIFVPETLSAAEMLAEMRQKTQIALVVDEYGGIAGLVTLEDVLEEIVGDIRDEHDAEEELIREQGDGSWIVDAVAHVEELESLFGIQIGERDFDTVGGLAVWGFGRVPAVGETLEIHGLRLEVLKADNRRVQRVRICRAAASPSEATSQS